MIFNVGKRRLRQLNAAQGYLILDMPDQALGELEEIDDPGESAFDWHVLRAEALRAKRDHQQALEAFLSAQQIRQDDLGALLGMAWCYKRLDKLHLSIETMHLAYQSHPEVPIVLYNLSCYYSLAHETEQALSWLARALRMDQGLCKLIATETDFDPLRNDPGFLRLMDLTAENSQGD